MHMFYLVHRYTLIRIITGPRIIKDVQLKSKDILNYLSIFQLLYIDN